MTGPRDRDLALIVPDRAGYGRSGFDPSVTIASGARDLGELIRHLGLDGCAVVGLSGGGPTALACGDVRLLRENDDLRAGFLDIDQIIEGLAPHQE